MKRILIIDDDRNIIDLVARRLEKNGYLVATAMDGLEGIAKAQEWAPDLIILDVYMPNLDGYSFLQEIRSDEKLRNTSILVTSANQGFEEIFQDVSIKQFLTKPFRTSELMDSVEKCLHNQMV